MLGLRGLWGLSREPPSGGSVPLDLQECGFALTPLLSPCYLSPTLGRDKVMQSRVFTSFFFFADISLEGGACAE